MKSNISFLILDDKLKIEAFIPVHLTAASNLSTARILISGAASAKIKLRTPVPDPKSIAYDAPLIKCLFFSINSANNLR